MRSAARCWALTVAAVVALSTGACTPPPDREAEIRPLADALAAALASGEVPAGLLEAPPGVDPERELAAVYAGMGIRPQVRVLEVVSNDEATQASVRLAYDWVVQEGKPAWSYAVPVGLTKGERGWQAAWSRQLVHLKLGAASELSARRLPAKRGEVVGNAGARLVFRQPVQRVGLDLTRVERGQAEASARRLAAQLGIDVEGYVARVRGAGPKAFVEAQVLRIGDAAHRDALAAVSDIPGVRFLDDERMLARSPNFARPLLGIVGEATAEAIDRSHGLVREGDVVGLTGLQAAYDGHLRGVAGYAVSADEELFRVDARPGKNLQLTLDADVQEAAEERLAGLSTPASIVVLRVSDGHVLAAASGRGGRGLSTATRGLYPVPRVPSDVAVTSGATSLTQASPLDVASAAASETAGKGVRARIVLLGDAPASAPLHDRAALKAWLDEVDADPAWAVVRTKDRAVVAHGDDPDALLARLDVQGR